MKQPGFVVKTLGTDTVKLTPGEIAVTYGCCAVVLQATPKRVPRAELNVTGISLFAVILLVFTTMLEDAAAITNAPAVEAPQTAGEALEVQLVVVNEPVTEILPADIAPDVLRLPGVTAPVTFRAGIARFPERKRSSCDRS